MLIKGLVAFVYDIEIFPNLFTCAIKNTETKNSRVFEISSRKNDLVEIVKLFLNKKIIFVGYNNIHYDNPIISFLIINFERLNMLPTWHICKEIKGISDTIIETKDNNFSSWSKYKYANLFETLDLLAMMFPSKLRVGLKELQVTMQYKNVKEYEGDFTLMIPENKIDDLIAYNINDVESTEELLYRNVKAIELRVNAEKVYNIKVLNKDSVNLGMEIIKKLYLNETGLTWKDIKDLRSPCDKLCLNDIIFDFVEFKTPVLKNLLSDLKKQCLSPNDNSFERQFYLGNTKHTFGMGGIHSVNKPEIIIPNDDEILVDQDVTSMYPSIILEHKVYPKHLGKEFLKVYGKIKEDRIEAKRNGNKLINDTLKLALNGFSGNLQNEYSWCYDPEAAITMRINGQLMLLMLAEALYLIGARICNSNTDGIFVLLKKYKMSELNEIRVWWENKTKLRLEDDYFERFYQYAINDYIGVKKGYSESKNKNLIKRKGMFLNDVSLGKGMQPMIIPEAIGNYFIENIPVEKTLNDCKDILKFCTYQKVDKKFQVLYGNERTSHINRFYMSTDGRELSKKDPLDITGRKPTSLCASSGVTIYNEFDDIPIEDRKINYLYYKKEIYKIIQALETQQLTLF